MKKTIIILIAFFLLTTVAAATSLTFSDVPADSWYFDSVNFVSEKGIMTGNNSEFRPSDPVTRAELAAIIQRISKDKVDTVAKVMPYCVSITTASGYGSGVVIKDNFILTANHVVLKGDIQILFGNNHTVKGEVLFRSLDDDLAIVKIPEGQFEALEIADSVQVGEEIIVIGNPLKNSFTVTAGVISYFSRYNQSHPYIQFDAAINSGSSGSPLFNMDGELVGIAVQKVADGIGYAAPYYKINKFIRERQVIE